MKRQRIVILASFFLFFLIQCNGEDTKCKQKCLNEGSCSPVTGLCICSPLCEGVQCETCHREVSYLTIALCVGGMIVCVILLFIMKSFIQRNCRFYSRVSIDDPFVNNMKSLGKMAGSTGLSKGDLYSSSAFELSTTPKWYRGKV